MKILNKLGAGMLIFLIYSCTNNQQSFESVKITVEKQIELDGRYYSPTKEGPGVLLLCQCDPTTDQNEYNSLATKLQKEGYHVMSFDYRGFGKSGGSKPDMTLMKSMNDAINYWRNHWLEDVHKAFSLLSTKKGVLKDKMTIIGASCGNFLALEYALNRANLKTLTLLGGPVDDEVINKLAGNEELPILIIAGSEGPTFQWVERIFEASKNEQSRIMKFKTVTHGTGIFQTERWTEDVIVAWLNNTLK